MFDQRQRSKAVAVFCSLHKNPFPPVSPCKCSSVSRCPPPSLTLALTPCLCCQVGRRLSGEADIGEERIPAEDMLSVPTDCKSGTYKEKRSVDGGGTGTVLC